MAAHRGDIYFVNLNFSQPEEQQTLRPVAVLSLNAINRLPLVVTVVVGTKGENVTRDYLSNVRVPPQDSGLSTETVFLGFQIRSLAPKRFSGPPIGHLSEDALKQIEDALKQIEEAVRYCLGL